MTPPIPIMTERLDHEVMLAVSAIVEAVAAGTTLFLYERRFIHARMGLLLYVAAWIACAAVTIGRFATFWNNHKYLVVADIGVFLSAVLAPGLTIVLTVPLVVRLYCKWLGEATTEAEKAPGRTGLRAWLSPANLALAFGISLCAWLGYGYSFWALLILTVGVLLAYPTVNTLAYAGQPLQAATDVASAGVHDERSRVLKLLEEGKITADEATELFTALGTTFRPHPVAPKGMTNARKLGVIGAAMVTVGFILPWYRIDIGQEMAHVGSMMSNFVNQMSPNRGTSPMPFLELPMKFDASSAFHITGGDVQHGFGWIILLLSVLAAVFPFMELNISYQARRALLMTPLAVGGFLIVYLLSHNIRHVSVGLPLVLAGYVLGFIGAMKEVRPAAHTPCA